jgi:hypothetical protein
LHKTHQSSSSLGLIWTLILRYQIQKCGDGGSAKNELLAWVRSKIPEYNINNFQKDWNDGKAICGLVNAVGGGNLIPGHRGLDPNNKLVNATNGIDTGYQALGVPKLVMPEEMNHPRVDEQAMMTYISYYRDVDLAKSKQRSLASQCSAFGPGLQEGIVNQLSDFTVLTPGKGKLEVKVSLLFLFLFPILLCPLSHSCPPFVLRTCIPSLFTRSLVPRTLHKSRSQTRAMEPTEWNTHLRYPETTKFT